eukprot:COSAG05_NODE_2426_length_3077_cov_4.195769_3_plen_269_part_00
MPFMRGQLARNKKEHATHCRRLPGGRPLIHIIEPKWWKDSKQRRQTCGGRGKPGMCDDPAKALPRIHTQISIVRREQLMLDTYATDRMCSESIHLLPTAELGRAAGTIRSAKLKIKDNLRLLERAAEEPYGAAGEKSGGQRLFKLGLVERGKQRYLKNLARGVEPLLRFEPTEMDGLSEMDRRVGLVLDILNDEFRGQMMPAETGGSEWGGARHNNRWVGSFDAFPELITGGAAAGGAAALASGEPPLREGEFTFRDFEWPSEDSEEL